MSQNVPSFRWTEQRVNAAALVAEDKSTDDQIAKQSGVDRRTLTRWKSEPAFQERVKSIVEAAREAVMTQGIADKVNRVRRLDEHWKSMQALIEARAEKTKRDVPGASTGLVVRREKETKWGTDIEAQFDAALLAELRATEMQAAKELGQWTEKSDVTSAGQPIVVKVLKDVSMDDL